MSLPLLHAGRTNPGLSAALDLRFALDKSLTAYRGPTPSFSRASTGSYFDGSGVLRYAVVNLVQYSSDFSNLYWSAASGTSKTPNYATDPEGKNTACRVTGNGYFQSGGVTKSAGTYTLSLWVRSTSGGSSSIRIFIDGGFTTQTISVTGTWTRVSMTQTFASSNSAAVGIYPDSSDILVWGFQLESGSTVGTYVPTTSSANSAPRFNHTYNGTSWVSRGLLVEEQRTNLLTYSNTFSSNWTPSACTLTLNDTTSPEGLVNAAKITSSGGYAALFQTVSVASSTTYTVSVFAKAGNRNFLSIEFRGSGASPDVTFDLSSGSVASGTGQIVNVGNGWFRCSVAKTSVDTSELVILGMQGPSTSSSNGDYIYIFGCQLEAGAFASSLISTTSSSATRSADVCQITGGDFTSIWNGTEGTLACEFDRLSPVTAGGQTYPRTFMIGSSGNNFIDHFTNTGSPYQEIFQAYSGGAQQFGFGGYINTGITTQKYALAFASNDSAVSVNGTTVQTDNTCTVPTVTANMSIGYNIQSGSSFLNGHIARLRYFNKRLPNATLQQLSNPDPTLNLQFALNKTLTPVAGPAPSFSRASTGSYFDSTGTLKYANVNLLTYSEQFDNAAWTDKAGSTLYTNAAASPNGDLSADQLQLSNSGYYYQKKAYTTTGTHTFSVWLRSSSPTTTLLRLSNDAGTENSVVTCNVTTSWQRFSVTRNWSANPVNFYAGLDQRTVVGGPGTSTDVFIWGAQLELASSPSQYAKTEASTTAGPRFDHVYSGGQWVSRGLLIEEQRTNGLLQSNGYGNSPWTIASSRGTVTQNAASPDGTNNAWTGNCTVTAPGGFYLIQGGLSSPSATYTLSFFAKKDNNGFVAIEAGETSNDVYVFFDLTNGLSGNLSSVGGYTNISHGLSDCGNGWYRCRLTFTKSNSNNLTAYIYPTCNSFSSLSCTSGQTNFIFGAQYETGSFATSYIGTTTSSVTRSADVCQITGTSFGWMWNQGEGSVVAEYDRLAIKSVEQQVFNASTSSGGQQVSYNLHPSNDYAMFWTGSIQAQLNTGSAIQAGVVGKNASSYKINDFAMSFNGGSIVSDTAGVVPIPDRLGLGSDLALGSFYLNGHIAKLIYYPARLTNTKLQQLST